MRMSILLWSIALRAGCAISVQAAVNRQLAGGLGGNTPAATLISFDVRTVALALVALSRGGMAAAIAGLSAQPPWRFASGVPGAAAIFSTVRLAPRIGLAMPAGAGDRGAVSVFARHRSLRTDRHDGTRGLAAEGGGALVMMAGVFLTLLSNAIAHAFQHAA